MVAIAAPIREPNPSVLAVIASGLGSVVPLESLRRLELVLVVPSTPRLFKVELAKKEWALKVVLVLVAVTVLLAAMLAQPVRARVRARGIRGDGFMGV